MNTKLESLTKGTNELKGKLEESSLGIGRLTDTTSPDFTFKLPQSKYVNMDVKFPIAHYEKYINEENASEKENYTLFADYTLCSSFADSPCSE